MAAFKCLDCGRIFTEPKAVQESRGEYWGFPAYETMYYCPYCEGDFEEVDKKEYWVSAYKFDGTQFGANIEAEDPDELFEIFYKEYPNCEIADYGDYGEEVD